MARPRSEGPPVEKVFLAVAWIALPIGMVTLAAVMYLF
jgi:hypothetical protein